jgi:hypothetical protein
MNGDVRDDGNRELGWSGRLFLSMWSGGLDLCETSEDPRATRGGDNCERFAITSAGTSGEVGGYLPSVVEVGGGSGCRALHARIRSSPLN